MDLSHHYIGDWSRTAGPLEHACPDKLSISSANMTLLMFGREFRIAHSGQHVTVRCRRGMQHSTSRTDGYSEQLKLARHVCADLLHVGAGNPSVGEEARVTALGLLARVRVGADRPVMAEAL